jgi:hypothetical protein
LNQWQVGGCVIKILNVYTPAVLWSLCKMISDLMFSGGAVARDTTDPLLEACKNVEKISS